MRAITRQFVPAFQCAAVMLALLCAAASPARAQDKAGGDRITVHGHWTIDVKNPDGSLASHAVFENGLIDGARLLSSMLATPGTPAFAWAITISGNNTFPITIATPSVAVAAPGFVPTSANLTTSVDATSGQLLLQGSATAPGTGAFFVVNTELFIGDHGQVANSSFSGRTLAQAINVQVGQIVQVTVAISFS
jgi:hypothetical protein